MTTRFGERTDARTAIIWILTLAATSLVGHAQQDPPAQPTFRAGVSLVEVATVVTDRDGRSIDDLEAEDFDVLENGQPRPLASVRRLVSPERRTANSAAPPDDTRLETLATNVGVADAPAFVLVLDDLNTSPYDAHRVIRAGLGVLGAIPPGALVAIVTTSGEGGSLLTLSPPTAEHAAQVRGFRGRVLLTGAKPSEMAEALVRTGGIQMGSTADTPCGSVGFGKRQSQDCGDPTRAARRAQVVESVAQLLGRAGSRRKVVFWITEDMGVSPLDPQGNQASQRAALQRVLNADVAVYPVNPREGQADMRTGADLTEGDRGDNRPDRRTGGLVRFGPADGALPGGVGRATTVEFNTDDMAAVTLDQIARMSGGRWITNANDLETVLADVVVQNSTSYVLAFEAAQAQTPGNHSIEVRVRRDGARVFARRGYVVPVTTAGDAATTAPAMAADAASLLRTVAMGTVPQGQLAMQVQVVPAFALGRDGGALVTVQVDPATAGDVAVDLVVLAIDNEGRMGNQQGFRMTSPEPGTSATWALTTTLPIARGVHQVRVAAVTADGTRSGLVIAPVEIIEPRNDLLMAPPVVLGGGADADVAPTLTRTFDVGTPLGLQVDVAGRPVRDKRVTVTASLQDARGATLRATDAVLDPGARADRIRGTAMVSTSDVDAGDYLLVVEARDAQGPATVRHAVPVTLRPVTAAAAAPADAPVATGTTGASRTGSTPPLRPLAVAHGPTSTHPRTGPQVIRDSATWTAFWLHLPTRQPPPDIDFERVTLLAFVIEGDAATPVQPAVERIEHDGDAVVVHWHAAPSTETGAPATTAAPPRPFTVVGIIGHDGPVRFQAVE